MKVAFLGHHKIVVSERLRIHIREVILKLIEEGADTFLFGSRSEFDSLCREAVTQFQRQYPNLKKIYVRAEYPDISRAYEEYLSKSYEETYFPQRAIGAGKSVYVKRNQEMIDVSDLCVFYYDREYRVPCGNHLPDGRKKTKRRSLTGMRCGRASRSSISSKSDVAIKAALRNPLRRVAFTAARDFSVLTKGKNVKITRNGICRRFDRGCGCAFFCNRNRRDGEQIRKEGIGWKWNYTIGFIRRYAFFSAFWSHKSRRAEISETETIFLGMKRIFWSAGAGSVVLFTFPRNMTVGILYMRHVPFFGRSFRYSSSDC